MLCSASWITQWHVQNAMEEANDRTKELLIQARGDETQVTVRVEDCGIGLDAEQAEKVFNPFFTTKPHGIGMGLSISRSIIESHEGPVARISSFRTTRPPSDASGQLTFALMSAGAPG